MKGRCPNVEAELEMSPKGRFLRNACLYGTPSCQESTKIGDS